MKFTVEASELEGLGGADIAPRSEASEWPLSSARTEGGVETEHDIAVQCTTHFFTLYSYTHHTRPSRETVLPVHSKNVCETHSVLGPGMGLGLKRRQP